MARVKLHFERIATVERLLNAVKQIGLDQLEAILACTFTFNQNYFAQLLDAIADCHPEGADLLRSIPVDVVCDHRHYSGHSGNYNVTLWPGNGLFHPKLFMLMFSQSVVWIEGSLNLTRAGYAVNQELVTFHESDGGLPGGVRDLIRQIAKVPVQAAKAIESGTWNSRTSAHNRSVNSLNTRLLEGFLERTRKAQSIYLVSPYFDRREQAGPSIEASALRALVGKYPRARFHIYLPEILRKDGSLALQGNRGLFASIFGKNAPLDTVSFCGVPSAERPLHAKLIAARYGKGGARASILAGSPNLTESALLKKGARANVELARELVLRWKDVERLLRPLGRGFKKLSQCRFEAPESTIADGWHAVSSATFHPLSGTLVLQWRRPDYARRTRVLYVGKQLQVSETGTVRRFGIRDEELRLRCVSAGDATRWSWCPIMIPYKSRLALAEMPDQGEPAPEWWLAQLGALSFSNAGDRRSRYESIRETADTSTFALGQKVRELASRMRYAAGMLQADSISEHRLRAHLGLLKKIFDSHDPSTAGSPEEQAWRTWVRLEVAQAVATAARGTRLGEIRRLKAELKKRLSSAPVSAALGHWNTLTESL